MSKPTSRHNRWEPVDLVQHQIVSAVAARQQDVARVMFKGGTLLRLPHQRQSGSAGDHQVMANRFGVAQMCRHLIEQAPDVIGAELWVRRHRLPEVGHVDWRSTTEK